MPDGGCRRVYDVRFNTVTGSAIIASVAKISPSGSERISSESDKFQARSRRRLKSFRFSSRTIDMLVDSSKPKTIKPINLHKFLAPNELRAYPVTSLRG